MNPQMNLLYLKKTGHVLATFTRSGEPGTSEKTADAFVGDGLHLRGLGDPTKYSTLDDFNNHQDFIVPNTEIAIFRTDNQGLVVISPQSSFLTNLDSTPSLQTISKGPLTSSPATIVNVPPTPNVVPTYPISIKLPAAVSTDTHVFILIEGPSLAQPLPIPFPPIPAAASGTAQQLPPLPTLGPGAYYALVFAEAYPLCVVPFKV
jgi:hypothetical protein